VDDKSVVELCTKGERGCVWRVQNEIPYSLDRCGSEGGVGVWRVKHHLIALTMGSVMTGVCMQCHQPCTYIGNQSKGRNIS
jgi:hypothetical protein